MTDRRAVYHRTSGTFEAKVLSRVRTTWVACRVPKRARTGH